MDVYVLREILGHSKNAESLNRLSLVQLFFEVTLPRHNGAKKAPSAQPAFNTFRGNSRIYLIFFCTLLAEKYIYTDGTIKFSNLTSTAKWLSAFTGVVRRISRVKSRVRNCSLPLQHLNKSLCCFGRMLRWPSPTHYMLCV